MKEETKKYRTVNHVNFIVPNTGDKNGDNSKNLEQFLLYKIGEITSEGQPEIIKFKFIKTYNLNETKENLVLEVEVPLIPATYDFKNSDTLRDDFFFKGSPEIAKKRYEDIIKNEIAKKNLDYHIAQNASTLAAYVCTQLNSKLSELSENPSIANKTAIKFIESLDCMKEHQKEHGKAYLSSPKVAIVNWMTQMVKDYELTKPQGQPTGGQPGDDNN